MQEYASITSGIHAQFDQELAEFLRPKYERYLKQTIPPSTPEEELKSPLVEKLTREVEKTQEREGMIVPMPTDNPQRPPTRRKQPA